MEQSMMCPGLASYTKSAPRKRGDALGFRFPSSRPLCQINRVVLEPATAEPASDAACVVARTTCPACRPDKRPLGFSQSSSGVRNAPKRSVRAPAKYLNPS
ncbi:hypothetical protein MRX96_025389 [Rhipicephalus microplus]